LYYFELRRVLAAAAATTMLVPGRRERHRESDERRSKLPSLELSTSKSSLYTESESMQVQSEQAAAVAKSSS